MAASAIFLAIVRFACWEGALFLAAVRVALVAGWQQRTVEFWLAVLAIEVTIESSIAGAFSFAGLNSQPAYWCAGALCLIGALAGRPLGSGLQLRTTGDATNAKSVWNAGWRWSYAFVAALAVPLVLLSFKPVEEIDSINYLHYLIEWLANRATPYTFATNYVAFWELSFAPVWMITRVDLFFPLLALKAVILMTLGLWLVGKQLSLPRSLLLPAVFASVVMQHYWYGPSGVGTLKNDVLHGVGFVLMTLVILRAAERPLTVCDIALLAFGVAFGAVKYTGLFAAVIAVGVVLFLRRTRKTPVGDALGRSGKASTGVSTRQTRVSAPRVMHFGGLGIAVLFLLTSGHYYLHNLLRYGSPFYPFQINLAFVHLPGTADLSNTSILYSLRDPRLWRALFLPAGGLSPAGALFPLVLAAILLVSVARCAKAALAWLGGRAMPAPRDWAAFFLLCGWLLYFRSVFSASAYSGDLAFILNGLNSIRYVDGVLAISELFLLAMLARPEWLGASLVAIQLISRLVLLYGKLELFGAAVVVMIAAIVLLLFLALRRYAIAVTILGLVTLGPLVVERNRERWTAYWNDLKPAIGAMTGRDLAELALPDGGYFAGHVVAAGNPADPKVRSLLPEEIEAMPAAARPRYLVVLVSPGSEAATNWESRYAAEIGGWGYRKLVPGKMGALFERTAMPRN